MELDSSREESKVNMGVINDLRKNYDEAIQSYKRAIEQDPSQPQVFVNLGGVYLRQQKYAAAQKNLQRAAELDPQMGLARERLGLCFYRQRKYEQALVAYEQALELDGQSATAQLGAGVAQMAIYLQDSKRESLRASAIRHWRRSLEIDPDQHYLQAILEKYARQAVQIVPGESEG